MATQRRSARKVEEDTSADDVSVDVIDVESVEEDNKVVQETQTESNEIAIFATHPMHWPGVGELRQRLGMGAGCEPVGRGAWRAPVHPHDAGGCQG